MKLTETRIKEIILEEIEAMSEQEQGAQEQGAQQQSGEKMQTDVTNMLKFVDRIDNVKKYSELLTALMKHDFGNDQQKKTVLKNLRNMINELIK